MTREDYIKTIITKNGIKVDVGLDDYGQCYYIEWIDPVTKKMNTVGCGTYNPNYSDAIKTLVGDYDEQ